MELRKGSVYLPKARKSGKVKYLCICAYPYDCEIMCIDGIQRGYRAKKYTFACVSSSNVSQDGKTGLRLMQKKAAEIGRYNSLYLLKYKLNEIRDPEDENLVCDYVSIIKELKPRIIYTYSLFDNDPIRVSVAVKVINALRTMKRSEHPKIIYGCEVASNLDWIKQEKLVYFNNSKNVRLQRRLLSVYKSKNYDFNLADSTIGKRLSNGGIFKLDNEFKLSTRAINMTTLLRRKDLPIKRFAMSFVEDLYSEINDSMDRSL